MHVHRMNTGSNLMDAPQGSSQTADRPFHSSLAHDLLRDWRRWNKAERIAAGFLLAALLIGTPALAIAALIGHQI